MRWVWQRKTVEGCGGVTYDWSDHRDWIENCHNKKR